MGIATPIADEALVNRGNRGLYNYGASDDWTIQRCQRMGFLPLNPTTPPPPAPRPPGPGPSSPASPLSKPPFSCECDSDSDEIIEAAYLM